MISTGCLRPGRVMVCPDAAIQTVNNRQRRARMEGLLYRTADNCCILLENVVISIDNRMITHDQQTAASWEVRKVRLCVTTPLRSRLCLLFVWAPILLSSAVVFGQGIGGNVHDIS